MQFITYRWRSDNPIHIRGFIITPTILLLVYKGADKKCPIILLNSYFR